ncbi:MAG: hypothetical protein WKF96_12435 [Solirubrobacteraceae bacterium]
MPENDDFELRSRSEDEQSVNDHEQRRDAAQESQGQEGAGEPFGAARLQVTQKHVEVARGHTATVSRRRASAKVTSPPAEGGKTSALRLPAPGVALEQVIDALCPPGALTWRFLPGSLPWIRPPGIHRPRKRPSDATLDDALSAAGVNHPTAREYVIHGPFTSLMVHSAAELHRNHGMAARAIEVAAELDVYGRPALELADFLGLNDHRTPNAGTPGETIGDPRGLRRHRQRGRELLRSLGVWPWVEIDDWRTTRRWWEHRPVVLALERWHEKEWMTAAEALLIGRRARANRLDFRGISITEYEACTQFRGNLDAFNRDRPVPTGPS